MILPAFLLFTAAAPATAATPAVPAVSMRHWNRMFISPMGEPFRPADRNDDALSDWFKGADRDNDGRLTIEDMQQDSERFFQVLDGNHDGEIDPDEITRYENVIAPEVTSGSSFGMTAGGGGRGSNLFRIGNDSHQGAGRFGLLDLPEPVVSADSNFNRGVSLAEFRQAAAQRFLALDLDHHGYLTLPNLETIRPAPPPAPKRPDEATRALDQSSLPDQ